MLGYTLSTDNSVQNLLFISLDNKPLFDPVNKLLVNKLS